MPFKRGPNVNPFAGASQEPIRLLESITPLEMASAVPFIKIVKIDERTGKADESLRPLMFDLIEGPAMGRDQSFGLDSESLQERANVSLNSLTVDTQLKVGIQILRQIKIKITAHRPAVVFDRFSRLPVRELLEEGKSFSLEYGWSADPGLVKNDLFNGLGHFTSTGYITKSTQTVLLVVYKFSLNYKETGDVEIDIEALENGDLALRETRFMDAFDDAFDIGALSRSTRFAVGNRSNEFRLQKMLRALTPIVIPKRDTFVRAGEIFDRIVAPMIDSACKNAGYPDAPELLLGNFNSRAGRQSNSYGGRDMGGITSIYDFLIPKSVLNDKVAPHFAHGRPLTLRNFIGIIIGIINDDSAWGPPPPDGDRKRARIVMKSDTLQTSVGLKLVITIFDRVGITDVFRKSDRLALEQQTRENIMATLESSNVPVLEFARASSVIQGASFQIQPKPLFHAILVEQAQDARKDRVQTATMPDVDSRKGQSLPKEIIPASIVEGDVTFVGNFVFETFGLLWIDFFGARSISGLFDTLEKTDTLEPGKFTTRVKFQSTGQDPLNTRFRKTPEEFAEDERKSKATTQKKK